MNVNRVREILKNKERYNICYKGKSICIQEVVDNVAKIGFIDGSGDEDVNIEDLYEDSCLGD